MFVEWMNGNSVASILSDLHEYTFFSLLPTSILHPPYQHPSSSHSFHCCFPRPSHLGWHGTSHKKGTTWKLFPCYDVETLSYVTGGPDNSWVYCLYPWSDPLQRLCTYVNFLVILMSATADSPTLGNIWSIALVQDQKTKKSGFSFKDQSEFYF